jgi:hypothetical protein
MQARARNQKPMKHKTAEEELRVKIETAKRDIRAKEESVAARRARKDAKREEWIIKQKADYEKREAKLQEQARMQPEAQGAEMDGARMMSTGAAEKTVVKEEDYDIDFDIDIYGDEQRRHRKGGRIPGTLLVTREPIGVCGAGFAGSVELECPFIASNFEPGLLPALSS